MRLRAGLLGAYLAMASLGADAGERLRVCFNYGCSAQAEAVFDDAQLQELAAMFLGADGPVTERKVIGAVVGRMLGWAGEQTPISTDRGGNFADGQENGRMDCIDHSTTTTRLLHLLEKQGWLRFHRVLEPVLRSRLLFFDHYAAQVQEKQGNVQGEAGREFGRYVVDSWFFDNGRPAVVMPLAAWLDWEEPDVDK